MTDVLLLVHAGATLFMTGLIWFVQIVHYPLFAFVSESEYAAYSSSHRVRTTCVVMPVMIIELMAAIFIAVGVGNIPMSPLWPWAGVGLLAIVWLSTFAIQVPIHARLTTRYMGVLVKALVGTNWIRTAAWSCRSIIALVMLT